MVLLIAKSAFETIRNLFDTILHKVPFTCSPFTFFSVFEEESVTKHYANFSSPLDTADRQELDINITLHK